MVYCFNGRGYVTISLITLLLVLDDKPLSMALVISSLYFTYCVFQSFSIRTLLFVGLSVLNGILLKRNHWLIFEARFG